MSLELARRLLQGGILSEDDLDATLLSSLQSSVSLSLTLSERSPEVSERVRKELSRSTLPAVSRLEPVPELAQRLPFGACQRLMAVPVGRDPDTGVVRVAVVDPFDTHVADEFGFHLATEIERVMAPHRLVQDALDGLSAGGAFLPSVERALSTSPRQPSEPPPIPLVRRAGSSAASKRAPEAARDSEPAPPSARTLQEDLESRFQAFAAADSPDSVMELLLDGLAPAGTVLLFAVRSSEFVGRASSDGVTHPETVRSLRVPISLEGMLSDAVIAGHYLGPATEAGAYRELAEQLPDADRDQVYVVPVNVSDHPAMVIVLTGFERAFLATQRADELARAAGAALERIVRARKRTAP